MSKDKPTQHEKLDEVLSLLKGDGEDGKVTLALVGERQAQIQTTLKRIVPVVEDHANRLVKAEQHIRWTERIGSALWGLAMLAVGFLRENK